MSSNERCCDSCRDTSPLVDGLNARGGINVPLGERCNDFSKFPVIGDPVSVLTNCSCNCFNCQECSLLGEVPGEVGERPSPARGDRGVFELSQGDLGVWAAHGCDFGDLGVWAAHSCDFDVWPRQDCLLGTELLMDEDEAIRFDGVEIMSRCPSRGGDFSPGACLLAAAAG